MKECCVEIRSAGGVMETFVVHPEQNGPFPAVVLYMDIWGLREELFDIARRVAVVGYYCIVPDLYYRQGKVRNAFRNHRNQMISVERLDEEQKAVVRAPLRQQTDAMVIEDTRAILGFIDGVDAVRPGPMGCIGYCMGGRYALRVAGELHERFRATACLHGSDLVTDRGDSPHFSARNAEGELYCGFAEKDRFASAATIAAMRETLATSPVKYHWEVHAGADHGYALPDRDVHDKQAANRDWELIFAMFHRQIPPYAAHDRLRMAPQ